MKRKLFFASVALAAVLVGCSKEEFTNVDNQLQELGDRPMVEAPVVTVGGAETKMTTSGSYAGVKWQAGDGFGAAVMDVYNGPKDKFEDMFTVVDYINSNVLFATEDGSNFYADASMPEGNHLFYAPFNKENISRAALATQMPLEQVVVNPSSNAAAPSNDIIKAFYEDGTSPVFVAYEKIFGEAKTTLDLQMRHIYSLPLVTLKLGDKVQVVDENGNHNVIENEKGEEVDVYESKITIDAIKFVNEMPWKGSIINKNIKANLSRDEDAEDPATTLIWDAVKYETAKTSDIVKFDALVANKVENIVVKFEGGQELTANKNGYFFMVLPGNAYDAASLAVKVYATINGKQYVSHATLTADDKAITPAKDVILLPGLPYSADEYNADGTMKNSKGTSMTYVIDGHFTATEEAVAEYTAISNYDELVSFVTDVAYRGEELIELTADQANEMLKDKDYDPKKYFVITATKNAPIVLDDAFVAAFKNACVIKGDATPASISFLERDDNNINLVLGDLTWNDEVSGLISLAGDNVYAKGNVVVDLEEGTVLPAIYTLDGATIDLEGDVAAAVRNYANAIVNINSDAAHSVISTNGTVNVLVSTAAEVNNGVTISSNNKTFVSKSTLNIADGVTMTSTINNGYGTTTAATTPKTYYAEVNVNSAIATITNNGKVTVNSDKAKLTVYGNGSVDNTIGGVVNNKGTNTVYATVSTFEDLDEIYDDLCGLNKLVVTGSVENDLTLEGINTIDFNAGSSLAIGNDTWDWTGKVININANVTWTGRDASVSVIKVDLGAITVTGKNKFNVIDIDLPGYQPVVESDAELAAAIAAGETRVVLNGGSYKLDLYTPTPRESLTITGTKNTKLAFDKQQFGLSNFGEVIIENCEIERMVSKSWGMLVFSTGKADGVYTVRNCTFKGVSTQGIYINEHNSSAVYNIENCTFDGDFGTEGAITIQCNTDVKHTINIKKCTFNNIPETSHKVCLVRPGVGVPVYKGWTLNTDLNSSDIYTMTY